MPPEIATHNDGHGWQNPYPPNGPEGYRKWQRIIHDLVQHCNEKWGDDIHNWYFEVWNEPDASGYFKGTLEEYLKIYDHTVAGAIAADPKIRVGGPGGAGPKWCGPLLQHCRSGMNDATRQKGCRIDFLSWHIYTVGVGIPVFDNLRLECEQVRSAMKDFPEYKNIPTLITEWGCASSPHLVHCRPYDAAFRTMAVREFMDQGITLALPFCLGEGPPHAHEGIMNGLAMFTKTTIPKPSFRAFELLHRMVGRRMACDSSNDPVGGLACLSEDKTKAWVILYNLIEKYDSRETRDFQHAEGGAPRANPYDTTVTIELKGLPSASAEGRSASGGDWKCRSTSIAPGECDPYLVWKDMGSPEKLTDAQRAALLRASELPAPQPRPVQGNTITITMPGFSVMLLELAL
jgi:xylan 1,4-beta-xylosidase